ncbi:MAG: lipoyl(octanoyl) transferase LipB [Candidatus Sericytochromatia bacterium]|nr:lipoyl(octanoyl) transferase LipB [Candidatus Sericytochromatia bacterium]
MVKIMSKIDILDLGLKDYKETLDLQYELLEKRISKQINDTLIFVEHPSVITLGRKSNLDNILKKDLPIYQVERGGDVTYHGPGQLIGYPIIDSNHEKDIHKFLRRIEEILILTLKEYDLQAQRKEKYTGVWIGEKKIASIGVSFRNWTSYHGFALNVSTDLDFFYNINPCGLESSIMTSMELLLNQKVDIEQLKSSIYHKFVDLF